MPVDEYHYTQWLGKDEALNRLSQHWGSFYTQQDFYDIASYGFNHVRIPIGYWAYLQLDGDPYVYGADQYLEQAIGWARNAGLKVWIDLHGAPGSQNGFDNSGLRDQVSWQQDYGNVQLTLDVLDIVSQKYGADQYSDVVTAIELLNEPLGPALDMNGVKQFFVDGYDTVRRGSHERAVVFHDSFMPIGYFSEGFMRLPDYYFAILDHHQYQVFSSGELSRDINTHVDVACGIGRSMQSEYHWRVTGEWSGALTDCSKWLNGVGVGARYDGSFNKNGVGSGWIGSCDGRQDASTWTDQQRSDTRRYIEAQLEAYDQGSGWIFWCYKTETSLEWDFRRLTDAGLFPQPFDQRQYPNTCGFW